MKLYKVTKLKQDSKVVTFEICNCIKALFVNFQLLKPDPMMVATKLLARKQFKHAGKQLNVIAASWIQFMIHDWMDHLESTKQVPSLCINL